jgi:hypothetical protein
LCLPRRKKDPGHILVVPAIVACRPGAENIFSLSAHDGASTSVLKTHDLHCSNNSTTSKGTTTMLRDREDYLDV